MTEVSDLFRDLFARAEHDMKFGQYLQKNKRRAEADWKQLAKTLGNDFFEDVRRSHDADTLIDRPPKQLLNETGSPKWEIDPEPIRDVESLFIRGVCRVRANFVHGDKYRGSKDDESRDEELVTQAKWVLEHALDQLRKK